MAKYTKEDVIECIENCKKKGIQDQWRLFLIQVGMRADVNPGVIDAVSRPELSEEQMQRILGLAVNGYPEAEILKLCSDPEHIPGYIERYYKKLYGADRQRIYQEIFDNFQVQWQKNFDQLLKQTNILSNMLQFMKSQLELKEREVKEASEQMSSLKIQLSQEAMQIKALEEEKATWKEQRDTETEEVGEVAVLDEEDLTEKYEDYGGLQELSRIKERWKQTDFIKKFFSGNPERKLIMLIECLNDEQIEEVLEGYEQGLTLSEIKLYAKPELSLRKMQEIKKLLLKSKTSD